MARTKRIDAPDELKFDLTHLYASRDEWEQDVEAVSEDLGRLGTFAGSVTKASDRLYDVLTLVEELDNRLDRINQYAHAQYMADASDADAQSLANRADALSQKLLTTKTFFIPEVLQASDDRIAQLIADDKRLDHYANYLQTLMRMRNHSLSAEGEGMLAALQRSVDGPNRLYGMLTNADLRCKPIERSDGSEEAVSIDTYLFKLSTDSDRNVRKAAYSSLMEGVKAYEQTLATNYLTHIQTQVSIAKLRHYHSAAEMFLEPDGIPVSFYRMALDVIMEEAKPIARRYVALQKHIQGIDKVRFYDLVAPLSDSGFRMSYEEGRAFIEESLLPLGEAYHRHLHAAMAERRIDLADNHGKFPIPVTLTSYGAPTYILSTWYDLLSDAMVLGHELGHLVHTDFTHAQNRFDADYSMLVAETASTTNEWMLYHHLKQSGDAQKVLLAARYLMEFDFVQLIGTLFVIEKLQADLYHKAEAGESVAAQDVSNIMARYVQDFYGEEFEVDEATDGLVWALWPQPIYPTLYPYCYASAFCMSNAITEAIQNEGQAAVDRYLKFLQSGGRKSSPDTYAIAGVDMLNEMTLRNGIRKFGTVLTELENLLQA